MQYVCNELSTDSVPTCLQWVAYEQPSLIDISTITQVVIVLILLWGLKSMFKIIISSMGINI